MPKKPTDEVPPSVAKSFRIPTDLVPHMERRRKELKCKDLTAYVTLVLRADAALQLVGGRR